MDTREKIVDAAQAARIAASGAIVVSGYFDPMVASHAERLESLKPAGGKLLVLISTPENAILPAAARAELVDVFLELIGAAARGLLGPPIKRRVGR